MERALTKWLGFFFYQLFIYLLFSSKENERSYECGIIYLVIKMSSLNQYRSMNHSEIKRQKIIKDYQLLFIGERKAMPKGTWEDDKNVIILFRFVVEIKKKLVEEEIPFKVQCFKTYQQNRQINGLSPRIKGS